MIRIDADLLARGELQHVLLLMLVGRLRTTHVTATGV